MAVDANEYYRRNHERPTELNIA